MPDDAGRLRPAAHRAPDGGAAATGPAGGGVPDGGAAKGPAGGGGAARWRVDTRLTAMRAAGSLVFVVAAVVLHADPLGVGLSGLAAVALLVYTARDVLAPIRLAADREGITLIAGFARRVRLPWDQIDRVRVDRRRRLGTVAELLEIDAGEALHLFSSYDLGVPPHEAERTLREIRAAG
jgi:hypothetical protein